MMQSNLNLQSIGRHLSALAIRYELVLDLLALPEIIDPGALNGADMYEGVRAAIVRRDETKALLGVEPFNCSRGHGTSFGKIKLHDGLYADAVMLQLSKNKI
jgi:hypothetical protein